MDFDIGPNVRPRVLRCANCGEKLDADGCGCTFTSAAPGTERPREMRPSPLAGDARRRDQRGRRGSGRGPGADVSGVWLGQVQSADGGSVEAIVSSKDEAREWMERAHQQAVEDGREMEAHVEEDGRFEGEPVGWWLPTDIEPMDDDDGWWFDKNQGGAIHGRVTIRRVTLPYYGWYGSPD